MAFRISSATSSSPRKQKRAGGRPLHHLRRHGGRPGRHQRRSSTSLPAGSIESARSSRDPPSKNRRAPSSNPARSIRTHSRPTMCSTKSCSFTSRRIRAPAKSSRAASTRRLCAGSSTGSISTNISAPRPRQESRDESVWLVPDAVAQNTRKIHSRRPKPGNLHRSGIEPETQ